MLVAAKDEIKALRAENKLMAARLEVFDNMMTLLNTHKQLHGSSMAPDIVYDIEKVVEEFKSKEQPSVRTLCTDTGSIGGECYGEVKPHA